MRIARDCPGQLPTYARSCSVTCQQRLRLDFGGRFTPSESAGFTMPITSASLLLGGVHFRLLDWVRLYERLCDLDPHHTPPGCAVPVPSLPVGQAWPQPYPEYEKRLGTGAGMGH